MLATAFTALFIYHNSERIYLKAHELALSSPLSSVTYSYDIDYNFFKGIDTKQQQQLIALLKAADEDDTVCLYINSPGGYVYAEKTIAHYMADSEATIVAVIAPHAYSAAAILSFNADLIQASPSSHMMFHLPHDGRGNTYGTDTDIGARSYKTLTSINNGRLTPQQMLDYVNKLDVYLGYSQIKTFYNTVEGVCK